MKRFISAILIILSLSLAFGAWDESKIPNPTLKLEQCNSDRKSFICDPDKLLKKETIKKLQILTSNLEETTLKTSQQRCGAGYQLAMLILDKKMDKPHQLSKSDRARAFAKKIHDNWGVGDAYCNNGIVIMFAREDREIYVSTGAGVKGILTDYMVTDLLGDTTPYFKRSQYDEGLLHLATQISQILIDNKQPPGFLSRLFWFLVKNWVLVFFASVLVFSVYAYFREIKRRNELKKKLEKLERIRNDILSDKGDKNKNKFEMKDCAICIDELDERSEYNRVLKCGHIFHRECIDSWNKTKDECPICRKPNDKQGGDEGEEHKRNSNPQEQERLQAETEWLHFSTSNLMFAYRDVSYGYVIPRHSIWTSPYTRNYETQRNIYIQEQRARSASSGGSGSSFGGGSSSGGGGGGSSW